MQEFLEDSLLSNSQLLYNDAENLSDVFEQVARRYNQRLAEEEEAMQK